MKNSGCRATLHFSQKDFVVLWQSPHLRWKPLPIQWLLLSQRTPEFILSGLPGAAKTLSRLCWLYIFCNSSKKLTLFLLKLSRSGFCPQQKLPDSDEYDKHYWLRNQDKNENWPPLFLASVTSHASTYILVSVVNSPIPLLYWKILCNCSLRTLFSLICLCAFFIGD